MTEDERLRSPGVFGTCRFAFVGLGLTMNVRQGSNGLQSGRCANFVPNCAKKRHGQPGRIALGRRRDTDPAYGRESGRTSCGDWSCARR